MDGIIGFTVFSAYYDLSTLICKEDRLNWWETKLYFIY